MGDPGNDVPSDRDSGDGFSLRGHTRAIRHLDAARAAGMATVLAVRPGNREPGGLFVHDAVESFTQIVV